MPDVAPYNGSIVTTRSKPKPFAWSYSRLKNYETCPKRHYHLDIQKDFKDDDGENEHLNYGKLVHETLAKRIDPKTQTPLPDAVKKLEPWAARILATPSTELLVEQQLAITKDYAPTTWFGNDVWYRGIADVLKINGPVALAIDWKTGKILEDGIQLALMAACIFAHHPEVQKIRTEFVWLKDEATSRADFTRESMISVWAGVLPRVTTLELAYKTTDFPAKPGGLCRRFCPVKSCVHNGV